MHIKTDKLVNNDACQRIVQAIIREQLLPFRIDQQQLTIVLASQSVKLIINDVKIYSLNRIAYQTPILWQKNNQTKTIENPLLLLEVIAPDIDATLKPGWSSFLDEFKNHLRNFKAIIEVHFDQHTPQDEKDPITYEQSVLWGHPYHPCNKTKLGFSSAEYSQYSPEFHHSVEVILAALDVSSCQVTAWDGSVYTAWFQAQFPEHYDRWARALSAKNLDPKDFQPLWVHPWQAVHQLPTRFELELRTGKLHLFSEITLPTQPTLSFRTMAVPSHPEIYLKLPVAVQSTSALRTVSPAATENGPKLSKILDAICRKEQHFGQRFWVLKELFGLHVKAANDDVMKHLGMIVRQQPRALGIECELPIVTAALFNPAPNNSEKLLDQLLNEAQLSTIEHAKAYFQRLCEIVLDSQLTLYLVYGIALEAHLQNTLLCFKNGWPEALLYRDLGGVRCHLPTLLAHGFNISPHPHSATFTDDQSACRNKCLHTTYQAFLGEWILALSQYFKCEEAQFWALAREHTLLCFDRLSSRVPKTVLDQERKAIVDAANWPFKALLSMRLLQKVSDYHFTDIPNPLLTEPLS